METQFILACREHACNPAELPSAYLFGVDRPFPNFTIAQIRSNTIQMAAWEREEGRLMIIVHSKDVELRNPPGVEVWRKIACLNRNIQGGALTVDRSGNGKRLMIIGCVHCTQKCVGVSNLKQVIWKTAAYLFRTWSSLHSDLFNLIQISLLSSAVPQPVRPPRTSLSSEQMKAILIDFLIYRGYRDFNQGSSKGVSRDPLLVYFAIKNTGDSLSDDSQALPFIFRLYSRGVLVLENVFSKGRGPYIIPKEQRTAFIRLGLMLSARTGRGVFRFDTTDNQMKYVQMMPFGSMREDDVRRALPVLFEDCTSHYKLYFAAFNLLLKSFPGPFDYSGCIAFCEERKPQYCEGNIECDPVTYYKRKCLSPKDFALEHQCKQQLFSIEEIRCYFLFEEVVFSMQDFSVSASVTSHTPLLQYLPSCQDPLGLSLAIIRICTGLAKFRISLSHLVDILFVSRSDYGELTVSLLPWELHTHINGDMSASLESVLRLIDANSSQQQLLISPRLQKLLIPPQELTLRKERLHLNSKKVRLLPLTRSQSRLTICYQAFAQLLTQLSSFDHILGLVNLPDDVSETFRVHSGWYRVDKDVRPLFTDHFDENNFGNRFAILNEIGEALISLHALGYCHFSLCPQHIGYLEGRVVFLEAAMRESMLNEPKFACIDGRFVAPEIVQDLLTEQCTACETADCYSFGMLVYFLLVKKEIYEPELGFGVDWSRAVELSPHLSELHDLHDSGHRPLIPPAFEEEYPMITNAMRLSCGPSSLRLSLSAFLETLQQEAPISLDFDSSFAEFT